MNTWRMNERIPNKDGQYMFIKNYCIYHQIHQELKLVERLSARNTSTTFDTGHRRFGILSQLLSQDTVQRAIRPTNEAGVNITIVTNIKIKFCT